MSPQPAVIDPPLGGIIMAVAAHPDDIESWCAGTLAGAIDAGATVRLLLVTSGDKGSNDPGDSAADVARRREREAAEAARLLGLAEVAFLRHPDGEVEDTRALRGELVAAIRRWRPAVLFTHDPERPYPPVHDAPRPPRGGPRRAGRGLSPGAGSAVLPGTRGRGPGLALFQRPPHRLRRHRRRL